MWRGMWRGAWRGLSRIVYNGHKKYHHIQKIINFALVFYKKVLSKDNREKNMQDVQVMVTLFAIVVLGYALRRFGLMGGDFDKRLSTLIIDVSCPLLILSSVMGDKLPDSRFILPLLCVGFVTYSLLTIAAFTLPKLISNDSLEQGMIGFCVMFGNVGFIGYPIVASIFGPQAIFYAALLNMPNTFFIFTVGVMLVKGERSIRDFKLKMLASPMMVAAYVAAVIVALGIHVPHVIGQPVSMVGNITVPGSLLVIGSSLARISMRKMLAHGKVYIATALRLVAVPVGLYVFFKACGVDELVNDINTTVVAMPVAAFGTMFCMKYERDSRLMTEMTFMSTVFSVLTIPLIRILIKLL